MSAVGSYSAVENEEIGGTILPGSLRYISGEHGLDNLGGFILHAGLSSLHIVCNVGIHLGQVAGSSY